LKLKHISESDGVQVSVTTIDLTILTFLSIELGFMDI